MTLTKGYIAFQINASIKGELSSSGKICIYAHKNLTRIPIDITEYYKTDFNNSFSNEWLVQWNNNETAFPQGIEDALDSIEPDYLETYMLVIDSNVENNITILSSTKKSRIEGCINGSIVGGFKGIIEGKINGQAKGIIDLRPKIITDTFLPLLDYFLNWVYFATPDYFIIFPYAPDYRYPNMPELSADFDWLQRPWYHEIFEQEQNATLHGIPPGSKSYFSKLGIDYVFNNLFISLGQAIYNETGGYEGIYVLDFNLEILMNVITLHLTNEDFNLICNSQGDILISPEYLQNISRKPKEIFPTENIYHQEYKSIIDVFNLALQSLNGHQILTINNTEYVVIYGAITSINWYMLHFSPLELILEDFNSIYTSMLNQLGVIRTILLVGSVIVITIVGTIALLVVRNFNSYLQKLMSGIHLLAAGDYSVSFEIGTKKQVDEFTEVLLAFEEMSIKLEEAMVKEKESSYIANLTLDLFGHDLANYHQALRGYLDLLSGFSEVKKPQITGIIKAMESIFERLESLRKKVARLQAIDHLGTKREKISIERIIQTAINKIYSLYPDYEIKIEKNYSKDLSIMANDLLIDVFEHLFDNSLKYAQEKKITFWISIKQEMTNIGLKTIFIIEDNGKGIPDALKESILYSFKTGYRIKGLGLVLVYKIIKKFSGELIIEDRIANNYRSGSKITFWILT